MPAPTAVNYLRHRPHDSALGRLDDVWPLTTHIAVRTLEELDRLSRISLAVAGVKRSKLPKPLVIPRPGQMPPPEPPKAGWLGQLINADAEAETNGVEVVRIGA